MRLSQEQYDKIKHILPVQRGNVTIDNLTLINALLYILENGAPRCLWSFKKSGVQSIGCSKGGLTTKIYLVSSDAKTAVDFTLSGGQAHDAPQGRNLLDVIGKQKTVVSLIMDKGYEDDYTRYIAQTLNFNPTVPPKSNRKNLWSYDKELYKRRNEIERFFRLIKGFRRIFTRYEKLDSMLIGFIQLALVFVVIR